MNMIELPTNIGNFSTMEELSLTYNENRYYLAEDEKKLFELIRDMHSVSLQLMEKQIPYLNATLLYGESGVGKTTFAKYIAYKLDLPYLYVNLTHALNKGMPLESLCDLMGHASIETTRIYAKNHMSKIQYEYDRYAS